MARFGLIIHPLDAKLDAARRYRRLAKLLPEWLIRLLARCWPPVVLARTTKVRSSGTDAEAVGWLIACPLTANQMQDLPPRIVQRKIIRAAQLAERLGADIVGLGGLASPAAAGGVAADPPARWSKIRSILSPPPGNC